MIIKKWKDNKLTSVGIESENVPVLFLKEDGELKSLSINKIPVVAFGGGSNSIISNVNKEEFILLRQFPKMPIFVLKDGFVHIKVGVGILLDDLIEYSIDNGFYGLEGLSGIPGTLGGAVVQNAGAYGIEISHFINNVLCWDTEKHIKIKLNKEDCYFALRTSVFINFPMRYIILEATISLDISKEFTINSRFLKLFGQVNSPNKLRKKIINHRNNKFPDPMQSPNSGSVFIHPWINANTFPVKKAREYGIKVILEGNMCKIPLGAVIEYAGLKGKKLTENLSISELHANMICRNGSADYKEWIRAVSIMSEKIFEIIGLVPLIEPVIIGNNLELDVKRKFRVIEARRI